MNRRRFLNTLLGVSTLAGFPTVQAWAGEHRKLKHVVYELDEKDPSHELAVLRNVKNNLNASGPTAMHIEIVIHGGGINLLKNAVLDDALQEKINGLKKDGVKFRVCNNTIHANKLDYKNDLYGVSSEDIVPSGVAYLVDRQLEGWAYMHP
ncbi:DsrE family protein [Halothiobacillus neapolitanus]|jgi:intracellular sulfur oxidation DsrE/DsrF family protein|uniref:Uncharacterized protein n=1 Tax=Halothiobacillus neapolitanus (strain ATCC 23641 / DSM 15147 / CIP 104769 / NCIMB 8539 / c2) TaxID=555778 RepID=D0KYY1_HALNC|nr:DsrE family protein [Halothiobacillus neapolitanus]ACX95654.1 Domain of unknown function DUF1791 [Halothiobacillus neapolitanus c2]OZB75179.1 MAG: hypothetical protein B7X37_03135 [Halothiobacillus sp. 14-55-98]TDN65957.1 hypothetical protein C8D83_101275 [Halothiobacillus neapolitanus]